MVIIAALAGGVVSLLGGLYLLYGHMSARTVQRVAVPFAAGALLAASFIDLLPEALEEGGGQLVMLTVLMGFIGFFLLERFIGWFHHHHEHTGEAKGRRSTKALIVVGDTLHNFIDGLAIGVAFLVNPATGIITTIAVAAHEIPQEVGDFGLLLAKGMSKKRIIIVNLLSALATLVGAVLVFGLGENFAISEPILLALTAGFFIYIAASDIIPTIHAEPRKIANLQALILMFGIFFVAATTTLAHQYITHPEHDESSHVDTEPHEE